MTVIAVTGHLDLSGPTVRLVRTALRRLLAHHPAAGLTGVSCLARGADALFAEAVLEAGGRLVAVIPSPAYRASVGEDYAPEFDRLREAAAEVVVLPFAVPGAAAYEAANAELLCRAELLVAVWDGLPGNGRGGTAHMVAAARRAGVPVEVVWPAGSQRGAAPRRAPGGAP
ncbi:hypothetical protein OG871_10235 [Kitasatospora sp. NBC_00374]|uniref:hypothetical protein n=1 Tax=Kitasatospora sp. NBC_00374 TaxID=2975964 RepID=UPI0030E11EDA